MDKKQALQYHAMGRPGKIEVVPTKPHSTQYDLSLAYSPGVAEPCRFDPLQIGGQSPAHKTPQKGKREQRQDQIERKAEVGIDAGLYGRRKRKQQQGNIDAAVKKDRIVDHQTEDQQLFPERFPDHAKHQKDTQKGVALSFRLFRKK